MRGRGAGTSPRSRGRPASRCPPTPTPGAAATAGCPGREFGLRGFGAVLLVVAAAAVAARGIVAAVSVAVVFGDAAVVVLAALSQSELEEGEAGELFLDPRSSPEADFGLVASGEGCYGLLGEVLVAHRLVMGTFFEGNPQCEADWTMQGASEGAGMLCRTKWSRGSGRSEKEQGDSIQGPSLNRTSGLDSRFFLRQRFVLG